MPDELSMDACRHCLSLLPTEGYHLPHVRPVLLQLGWYALHKRGVCFLQGTKLAMDEVQNDL